MRRGRSVRDPRRRRRRARPRPRRRRSPSLPACAADRGHARGAESRVATAPARRASSSTSTTSASRRSAAAAARKGAARSPALSGVVANTPECIFTPAGCPARGALADDVEMSRAVPSPPAKRIRSTPRRQRGAAAWVSAAGRLAAGTARSSSSARRPVPGNGGGAERARGDEEGRVRRDEPGAVRSPGRARSGRERRCPERAGPGERLGPVCAARSATRPPRPATGLTTRPRRGGTELTRGRLPKAGHSPWVKG